MNIKEARGKLGLTQKELAEKLCIGQSAVGNWESGIRNPSRLAVKIIQDMLDKQAKSTTH